MKKENFSSFLGRLTGKKFLLNLTFGFLAVTFLGLMALAGMAMTEKSDHIKSVQITNVVGSAVTITWVSSEPTYSKVYYSKDLEVSGYKLNTEKFKVAFDDRDLTQKEDGTYVVKDSGNQKRHTHHVTLRGLEENTNYNFGIDGRFKVLKLEEVSTVNSGVLKDVVAPRSAYGEVKNISNDAIAIFATFNEFTNKEIVVSTTINEAGRYAFDFNELGTEIENALGLAIQVQDKDKDITGYGFTKAEIAPLETVEIVDPTEDVEVSDDSDALGTLLGKVKAQEGGLTEIGNCTPDSPAWIKANNTMNIRAGKTTNSVIVGSKAINSSSEGTFVQIDSMNCNGYNEMENGYYWAQDNGIGYVAIINKYITFTAPDSMTGIFTNIIPASPPVILNTSVCNLGYKAKAVYGESRLNIRENSFSNADVLRVVTGNSLGTINTGCGVESEWLKFLNTQNDTYEFISLELVEPLTGAIENGVTKEIAKYADGYETTVGTLFESTLTKYFSENLNLANNAPSFNITCTRQNDYKITCGDILSNKTDLIITIQSKIGLPKGVSATVSEQQVMDEIKRLGIQSVGDIDADLLITTTFTSQNLTDLKTTLKNELTTYFRNDLRMGSSAPAFDDPTCQISDDNKTITCTDITKSGNSIIFQSFLLVPNGGNIPASEVRNEILKLGITAPDQVEVPIVTVTQNKVCFGVVCTCDSVNTFIPTFVSLPITTDSESITTSLTNNGYYTASDGKQYNFMGYEIGTNMMVRSKPSTTSTKNFVIKSVIEKEIAKQINPSEKYYGQDVKITDNFYILTEEGAVFRKVTYGGGNNMLGFVKDILLTTYIAHKPEDLFASTTASIYFNSHNATCKNEIVVGEYDFRGKVKASSIDLKTLIKKASAQSEPPRPDAIDFSKLESGEYLLEIPGYQNAQITLTKDNIQVNFYQDKNGNGKKDADEELVDVNQFGVKLSKVKEIKLYQIEEGWNLIGIPVAPEGITKASDFLKEGYRQDLQIEQISKYDAGNWVHFVASGGAFSDSYKEFGADFALIPGEGYFVRSESRGNMTLYGKTFEEGVPISMEEGWNLRAIQSKEEYTNGKVLSRCREGGIGCEEIYKYEDDKYEGYVYREGEYYGLEEEIEKQRGYFIKVVGEGGVWTP